MKRDGTLAARVATAQKRMVATHPRREVADMEVKEGTPPVDVSSSEA